MGSDASPPLKLFFIPYLGPSHFFPLFETARVFASRGEHVTFFTTPSTVDVLRKTLDADPFGHNVTLFVLTLPTKEAGVPDGVDFSTPKPDVETSKKLYYALTLLQPDLEEFIKTTRPDCIVSDKFYPWSADLGIPRLVFHIYSIFGQSAQEALTRPDSPHWKIESDYEPFVIPGLPDPITMTRSELPVYIRSKHEYSPLLEIWKQSELKSYAGLANGFPELESDYAEHYGKVMGHKIYHLGPADRVLRATGSNKGGAGGAYVKSAVGDDEFLSWLNSKKPNSVLYISFGSLSAFPDEQLMEIAHGLEASGCDFIWVVKGKDENETAEEKEKWLPKGMEEKIKEDGRGLIVRGWAPQVMILDHPSVGGFLTHCGLSSLLEGVFNAVPFLTWPLFAEQFFNEKLATQVLKIGVELGAKDWNLWVDVGKNVIGREIIERGVRRLMMAGNDDEEVAMIRRNVKELSQKGKRAVQEGGSSVNNMTCLIQELKELRDQNKAAN